MLSWLCLWRKNRARRVYVLSKFHRPTLAATERKNKEGKVIEKHHGHAYNNYLDLVDKLDSVLVQNTITTKCAIHLVEEALYNSYVCHQYKNDKLRCNDFIKLMLRRNCLGFKERKQLVDTIRNNSLPRTNSEDRQKKYPTQQCAYMKNVLNSDTDVNIVVRIQPFMCVGLRTLS